MPPTPQIKCIYCLQEKSADHYQKREHVIPQCLGRFSTNNIVLREYVCDECNQFFGDKLELFLGRDSYESLERIKHGLGPKTPLKNHRRIKIKIDEGEYKNVLTEIIKSDVPGEIGLTYSLQVGFYNEITEEYEYFKPDDILPEQLKEAGYKLDRICIIADNDELPKLTETLKRKGINVSPKNSSGESNLPAGPAYVRSNLTIDKTIARALSKIAFNYLASVLGREIVLRDDFDGIRQFIRHDIGNLKQFVFVNLPPILRDDQIAQKFDAKITQGHMICIEKRNNAIISKVSLFNSYTYGVLLCPRYWGRIYFEIYSGHFFDFDSEVVHTLYSDRLLRR